ncbi:hypothetical protein [Microbacterium sp.]|uniref:hypothetical protein n=1 Tax=Microbacterium sp. TaxID=51671 RepID=UPI003A8D6E9C
MSGSGGAEGAAQAAPDDAPARPARARWVTAVADRVPAKWLGGIATGVVLISTAAFGGLEAVAVPPLPELSAGETFTDAALEMTVRHAFAVDELSDTRVTAAPGERLLVVVMDAENLDEDPRSSAGTGSLSDVRVEGMPDAAPTIARVDDATYSPWLQPGVPAELMLTWAVPASAFVDGDDLRVALPTAHKQTGKYFIAGDYWTDVSVAAHVTLVVEDLDRSDAE